MQKKAQSVRGGLRRMAGPFTSGPESFVGRALTAEQIAHHGHQIHSGSLVVVPRLPT